MRLYEEYKEYETLWDDLPQEVPPLLEEALDTTRLDEGKLLMVTEKALDMVVDFMLIFFKVIEKAAIFLASAAGSLANALVKLLQAAWLVILSGVRLGVFGLSVVEELSLLVISSIVRGFTVILETAVTPLVEGPEEDTVDRLEQAILKFSFEDLAREDPELRKYLQELYALADPEKAPQVRELLINTENQIRQQARPLAEDLKNAKPEDLEVLKKKLIKVSKKQFEKGFKKLQKTTPQVNVQFEQMID
jgi:hypothetical protein